MCKKSLSLTTESRVVVKLLLKFQTKNLSFVSPARTAKMKRDETKERGLLVPI